MVRGTGVVPGDVTIGLPWEAGPVCRCIIMVPRSGRFVAGVQVLLPFISFEPETP
jgi:hypothetical protein